MPRTLEKGISQGKPSLLFRSGDDHALAVGQDIPEGMILEQGEGVVRVEAGTLAGGGQDDPGAGGGRTGEATQETGELARATEGAVAFFQQGLDGGNMPGGEIGGGSSRNGTGRGMGEA